MTGRKKRWDAGIDREAYAREYRTPGLIFVLMTQAFAGGVSIGCTLMLMALDNGYTHLRPAVEITQFAFVAINFLGIGYIAYRHLRTMRLARKRPAVS